VPLEDLAPDHAEETLEARLLVVEERAERADVDDRDGRTRLRERERERGMIADSVFPPAVGARTTQFAPSRIASIAISWTGRRPSKRSVLTTWY
jgi:hypothetical protein